MPRDGLQQYAPPPGTDGIPNYTVESARYNAFTHDITADQNNPRPIVAGGTGAANAHDAMIALSGEIANQGPVTNYDSFPFVAGSFWSAAGATSAPNAINRFNGICIAINDGSGDLRLEVATPGGPAPYYRSKISGVWSAWALRPGAVADLDAAYVNVTGDTMTGPLVVNATFTVGGSVTPAMYMVPSSGATAQTQIYQNANLYAFTSIGAGLGNIYNINLINGLMNYYGPMAMLNTTASTSPTTGALTVAGGVGIAGAINAGADSKITGNFFIQHATVPASGYLFFGNTSTKYLNYDGTNFSFTGGNVVSNFGFMSAPSGSTGAYYFGNTSKYLSFDGTNFNLVGGAVTVPLLSCSGNVICGGSLSVTVGATMSGDVTIYRAGSPSIGAIYLNSAQTAQFFFDGAGYFNLVGGGLRVPGHGCRSGTGGAYGAEQFNLFYSAGIMQLWANATNMGNISLTSDYRIKKDVIDLPGMWDTVKALRPIKYTQAQFSPPSHIKFVAEEALKARKEAEENPEAKPREVSAAPLFPADDIERWGFIAHELQATLTPSAATGVKDSPDTIQSPNPFTVIAALTKALQEAMARIEALEATR